MTEFPDLLILDVPGYHINYSEKFLFVKLLAQLNQVRSVIAEEHEWLQQTILAHNIDWVISDNRYGCYSDSVPCTFVGHQLLVKLPWLLRPAELILQSLLFRYINHFTNCWIPDLADNERGLSGILGHPGNKPAIPVTYVGWLSRFDPLSESADEIYDAAVVLSGPEPQRTLLENLVLTQAVRMKRKLVLVRGLPGQQQVLQSTGDLKVFNHLAAKELQALIIHSRFIIARSGYSTVMDMFTMQKKCIFIPTPGQTEQEYLGKMLADRQMALVYRQNEFDLPSALENAGRFAFHFPLNSMNDLLGMAVESFIETHFDAHTEPASLNQ